MNKTKYIVFLNGYNKEIIIFGCTMTHVEVAQQMQLSDANILSAGFVSVGMNSHNEIEVNCHGRSESLGLKSDQERDSFLALHALGLVY